MELKQKLIIKCRAQVGSMIDDLKKEISEAQQSANDYGTPRDRYDAYRNQMIRKRDMFAQQLAKVRVQVEVLDKIDPEKIFKEVKFGAIVITSAQNIFVATGLGRIQLDDEIYYAISPVVPIFKAMEGKKEGEEFLMNGKQIKITKIY